MKLRKHGHRYACCLCGTVLCAVKVEKSHVTLKCAGCNRTARIPKSSLVFGDYKHARKKRTHHNG